MREIDFRYSKKSEKFFVKHPKIKDKFISNILEVCRGNHNIDIKPLKGLDDVLRMRINDYRVIYKMLNGELIIVDVLLVGNRGEIYKKI